MSDLGSIPSLKQAIFSLGESMSKETRSNAAKLLMGFNLVMDFCTSWSDCNERSRLLISILK